MEEYITISDIKNKTITNYIAQLNSYSASLDEIQDYVDRTNEYYVDLAQQVRVAEDDILFPVPIIAREHLLNYLSWNYAKENGGVINSDTGYADTTYANMEESNYTYYTDSLKHMTGQYISGQADSTNRVSTSFGYMVR